MNRAPQKKFDQHWYAVIHILPTRERLAAMNLTDTANCRQCDANDSLSHRLNGMRGGARLLVLDKEQIRHDAQDRSEARAH